METEQTLAAKEARLAVVKGLRADLAKQQPFDYQSDLVLVEEEAKLVSDIFWSNF